MRKIYLSVLGLITASGLYSQAFWTPTTYKGAFPVTDGTTGITSNDWTAGWCNWDPQNVNYPSTTVTVSADITTNTTWTTGTVVFLQNKVYVTNGATLTIQPGVIIRGDQATGGTLIITRGAKINAQGTQSNPIVFTSNQAAGSRNLGDWGGVVILGNARNNQPGGVAVIEGGLDPVKAQFGGTNDLDNSGIFSYVRIEFAGIPFQVDKEINGLTMGSVGSGTTIDHVQCSFINDDAFEWFGGTVNAKYLVAFRSLDDDFDTDFGYRGNVQFGLVVRDPNIADQSTSSTSEGFESDNDATGTNATPYTAPVFSNITLIGPYRGSTGNSIDPKFRRALRLRRNTYTSVFNSIFTDFPTGLHIDGSAAIANALTDSLRFENNVFAGMGTGKNLDITSTSAIRTWFNTNGNDTTLASNASGLLVSPYNFTAGDYRLKTNSPASTGGTFNDPFILAGGLLPTQQTSWWTCTSYKGAFPVTDGTTGIASNDWTAGWCNWDPQNANYPSTTITVSSDITTNTTWATGTVVLLQNKVYVTNGATLTIQPGVIIRGDQATGGTLIITRGAKINAQGTQSNPIVFTSNQASGSRNLGDWGGIVILGNARNNQPGGVAVIEGGLDPVKAQFGGTDDNDSSGVFSYVRIEFGGIPFQVDKEINGLTMGSVGSRTKIDHVQCSFINDDAFEWFGGTVNSKYLVAFRSLDDDFDTDFGYRGNIQFGLIVRDPNIADQSTSSTSEGFESDNDATGTNATPYTAPVFSNITMVGPYRGSTSNPIDPKFRRALRLRRNTYTSVFNSIFTDFPTGLHIDGSAAIANALTDSLRFENNIFTGMGTGKNLDITSTSAVRNWFNSNGNDTTAASNAAGLLVAPYNFTAGDYRLSLNSVAATGANFTDGFITANGISNNTINLTSTAGTNNQTICDNNAITAITYATTGATGASFTGLPAGVNGTWNANTINISGTPTATGSFNYTVTLTGGCNSSTVTSTGTITVNARPTVSINGNTSICNGQSTTLTASGANTYSWNTSSTTSTLTVNPTSSTGYTVTGTASNGCSSTATSSVVVNSLPVISISGSSAICNGQNAALTASGAASYSWNTGALNAQLVVNPTNTTSYTVTGTDANNCSSTASATVTVNQLPTVAITGTTTICNGQSTTLTGTGASTYSWNGGATTNTVSVNPISTSSYTVTGTDANGCFNTASTTVTVNALPTVAISGTTTICNGESTTFTATGASTYLWNNSATTSTITVNPSSNTSYSVTGTNANGCLSTATLNLTVNALPIVAINGTTTICEGQSTSLTASGASTYSWNTGFPGAIFSVNPSTTTSYTVTGTSANGCASSANVTVVVNNLAILTSNPLITNASCGLADGSIVGLAFSGNSPFVFNWFNANNTTVSSTTDLTNALAGVYNLSITDANSCITTFGPYSISNPGAPQVPTITISDSTVCEGASITLSALSTGTTITYQWSGPGGFSSTNANETINAAALNNNGVVSVTATENNCTSAPATVNLTVYQLPVVGLGSSAASVCENGSSVTLNGSPVGGSYSGNGVNGNTFSPATLSIGSYTITYNYTDLNSCSNTATTSIVINALPTVSSTAANNSVCANSTVNALNGLPTGGTFTGNGVNGTNFNATVAGVGAQTITYSFTDANGCSATSSTTITVNALPVVSVTAANDSACVQENSLSLTGLPSGGTYSGTAVTGSTFNPSVAGIGLFSISYSYTDANSCSNTSSTSVLVSSCVGVEELMNNETIVNVYPNPANDQVNLFVSNMNDKLACALFNSVGQLVKVIKPEMENLIDNNTINFSTDNFNNGLYFIKVYDNNGFTKTIRLIINK